MDRETLEALHLVFLAPRSIQSDFSRERAQEVAALASQGYITTCQAKDTYGRQWRITPTGQTVLVARGLL